MIDTGVSAATPLMMASLQQRRELAPGAKMSGFECTIGVADIQKVAAAIEENGGTIVMQVCTLAGIGRLLYFQDPEGNLAGAMGVRRERGVMRYRPGNLPDLGERRHQKPRGREPLRGRAA